MTDRLPAEDQRVQCASCGRWPMAKNWPNHMQSQGGPHWPVLYAEAAPAPDLLAAVEALRAWDEAMDHADDDGFVDGEWWEPLVRAMDDLRAAPSREAGLDVEPDWPRVAEAWASVMDGRRVGDGLNAARINGGTTTRIEDWAAIAAEYARLATVPANPEGERE